jgi:hypothetical protein
MSHYKGETDYLIMILDLMLTYPMTPDLLNFWSRDSNGKCYRTLW